jgi:hypothetical protein
MLAWVPNLGFAASEVDAPEALSAAFLVYAWTWEIWAK